MTKLREMIAWFRARPTVFDGLLAGVLFVLSVVGLFEPSMSTKASFRAGDVLGLVLVAGLTLPLVFRRRAPVAVVAMTTFALVPFIVLRYSDTTATLGSLIAIYSLGAHSRARRTSMLTMVAALAFILPCFFFAFSADEIDLPVMSVIGNVIVYVTAWILGDSLRTRRAYLRELEGRAEAADQQRAEEARRAVAAERARIARELHDVVAHGMSVMVVQAGAARRVLETEGGEPDQAIAAIAQVEATGREALVEMRRLLGVLRDEAEPTGPADLTPQPSLQALDALVDTYREAGLAIEMEIDGTPRPVPAGTDLSAYRIIQEALTNTIKHAGPATAKVLLAFRGQELAIDVVDDGRGASAAPAANGNGSAHGANPGGSGHGLIGMRERAALVGGRVDAGPRSGGGFAVHATLPLREAAP